MRCGRSGPQRWRSAAPKGSRRMRVPSPSASTSDPESRAMDSAGERNRLVAVTLDEASIGRGNPDQEHERAIAIYDILEANSFRIPEHDRGPYALHLSLLEKK